MGSANLWSCFSRSIWHRGLEDLEEAGTGGAGTPFSEDFWSFLDALFVASEKGDLASVKLLMDARGEDLVARFALSFHDTCRTSLSIACAYDHLNVVAYWLDDSSLTPPLQINDYVPHHDDVQCYSWRENGVMASLLWVAAARGHCDLAQALLARGVKLEAPASDGSTPFYVGCEQGHTAMVRLLSKQQVDMRYSNEDGTTPIHAAAMNGHLEVVRFLHESGVDVETQGTILHWNQERFERGYCLLSGVTLPRMIAQRYGDQELLQWLDSLIQPLAEIGKRERSSTAPLERAQLAGVADMLKSIPTGLHARIASGSKEDAAVAKKELHKLQKYNNQVISRAEKKKLKQSTLSF